MILTAIQQAPNQDVPNWVLLSLLSLLFTICIGLFVWIVNRVITQHDDSQKQNQENFKRLTDAVVGIEKTTLVQTEILKNHSDDLRAHDDILRTLAGATRTKR